MDRVVLTEAKISPVQLGSVRSADGLITEINGEDSLSEWEELAGFEILFPENELEFLEEQTQKAGISVQSYLLWVILDKMIQTKLKRRDYG